MLGAYFVFEAPQRNEVNECPGGHVPTPAPEAKMAPGGGLIYVGFAWALVSGASGMTGQSTPPKKGGVVSNFPDVRSFEFLVRFLCFARLLHFWCVHCSVGRKLRKFLFCFARPLARFNGQALQDDSRTIYKRLNSAPYSLPEKRQGGRTFAAGGTRSKVPTRVSSLMPAGQRTRSHCRRRGSRRRQADRPRRLNPLRMWPRLWKRKM